MTNRITHAALRTTRLVMAAGGVFVLTTLFCSDPRFERGTVSVNNQSLQVEIAASPRARSRGLMYRKELGDIQGMLFIFEKDGYHGFWMKNTYIPLEIIFISRNFEIVDLDTMAPLDTASHLPLAPVKYALELPLGSLERYTIRLGDTVRYQIQD